MLADLKITRVTNSRLPQTDYSALGFGNVFSDHMFSMIYEDGQWQHPEILPFGPVEVHPANSALHYGQSIFEGLKAYRGVDDKARVFRPDMNLKRLDNSCDRLCIPRIDESIFYTAIDKLIELDHAWIPTGPGQALYIRPLIYSDEGYLEVRPAQRFRLLVMTSPVRAYFSENMNAIGLKAEATYTRAAPGGAGYAKTGGNYGASLFPGAEARQEGYDQVLWLDGVEHRYVEEVGAMNIFFRVGETVITPDLHGTILPGVTRDSVIHLLREAGHKVEERRIEIHDVMRDSQSGELNESFCAGTAAIIVPVGRLMHDNNTVTINNQQTGEITRWLYHQLTGIQTGALDDENNWCRVINTDTEVAA
jgi:branched-chain amino acid aminotransferase